MSAFQRTPRISKTRLMGLAGSGAAVAIASETSRDANAGVISSGSQEVNYGARGAFELDIDLDGSVEYRFANGSAKGTHIVSPIESGALWVDSASTNDSPARLTHGDLINADDGFVAASDSWLVASSSTGAQWQRGILGADGDSGYMGLQFDLAGNTHYGWAHITANSNFSITIHDWAYESTPGVGILAGATSSLAAVPEPASAMTFGAILVSQAFLLRRRR